MPLSTLLDLCGKQDQADQLLHSSLHLVCLGLRGKPNMSEITGCIYYPEVGTIFHKACVFSQVDSDSVPDKELLKNCPGLRLYRLYPCSLSASVGNMT